MTAKKAEAKPKKRESKQAEKAAAKKDTKSKATSKGKKNYPNILLTKIDKVMESHLNSQFVSDQIISKSHLSLYY